MFAPLVAKAKSTGPLPAKAVEQTHMARGHIGDQASFFAPQASRTQDATDAQTTASNAAGQRTALSWDFSKIPLHPPGHAERPKAPPLSPLPRLPIQAKLKVGAVDDPLEHEADRVADQVMRMPAREVAATPAAPQLSRKCAECEHEEKLQKKEAATAAPALSEAPASVHATLRSPGQPLDAATRAYFEPRFGYDFSQVRVHTNEQAFSSAKTVNAHAYTVENRIVFGSGAWSPRTDAGRRLLAHELAHVVQQGGPYMVRRTVLYPEPTVTTEDPIRRVLSIPGSAFALTTPTVNGTELTGSNAIGEIKQAFQPKAVESKSTEKSGSGASSRCSFKDFDINISANIRWPNPPSGERWGPIQVDGTTLVGSPPPNCRTNKHINVEMVGEPDTATFYKRVQANEKEHVDDIKGAATQYLLPYYQAIMALRSSVPGSCEKDLQDQLKIHSEDNIRDFLKTMLEGIKRRDVPGKHVNQATTQVGPNCASMKITARPTKSAGR